MAEKKELDEEGMATGRLLGAAARWGSPRLIDELRLLARKKKKKTYEIMAEALEIYKLVDEIEHIDPKHLVAAMILIERHIELAIKMVASASSLFTSELIQSMLQSYQKIDEVRQQVQAQQAQQPIEQPAEMDYRSMLMPYVYSIVSTVLSTVQSILIGRPVTMPPMPTLKQPKVKVVE